MPDVSNLTTSVKVGLTFYRQRRVDGGIRTGVMVGDETVLELFEGGDEEAVAEARDRWQIAKSRGFAVTYWQADESGRWQRRA